MPWRGSHRTSAMTKWRFIASPATEAVVCLLFIKKMFTKSEHDDSDLLIIIQRWIKLLSYEWIRLSYLVESKTCSACWSAPCCSCLPLSMLIQSKQIQYLFRWLKLLSVQSLFPWLKCFKLPLLFVQHAHPVKTDQSTRGFWASIVGIFPIHTLHSIQTCLLQFKTIIVVLT